MKESLLRLVGRRVEIVYLDRHNRFSQRYIEIRSIEGNQVKAFCLTHGAPRVFRTDRILALRPAGWRAAGQ